MIVRAGSVGNPLPPRVSGQKLFNPQESPGVCGQFAIDSLEFDLDEGELIVIDVDDIVGDAGEACV
jgi:hypothetical protein